MVYHWQSANVKVSGVDDLVLLSKISDDSIVENLKKRFMDDYIFTYIGPVLVSINPFKQMQYFGEKEINQYQGAACYENPPHIYAIADNMYRNMLIDQENQCVIISGESGSGKTVSAKYIMNYIAKISGGGNTVQQLKDTVLESNPFLEAFGNARTVRNNNSSRFGKYVEIQFNRGGQPCGAKISNFLLEKSRVVSMNSTERGFHIFYQLCFGATEQMKNELALTQPDYFAYLNQSSCFHVEGISDPADFQETLQAMKIIGISQQEQRDIFQVIGGILHLGNVEFFEDGNYASISDNQMLQYPAALFDIDANQLGTKLISRIMDGKWGRQQEAIEVTLGLEQAIITRDALAKALYARLFDFLVKRVNNAMSNGSSDGLTIGILDIYGFEIFETNGFEQFCINYVNEKLQQIFIELTLKAEQEEYVQENIRWVPIDYFNNQIVCDLIEGKRPPGVFAVLNDVCATMHAVTNNADFDFQKKISKEMAQNKYIQQSAEGFIIHHYAGMVSYDVNSFCDKNRDVLFQDLIKLMKGSKSKFIQSLFPDQINNNNQQRPTTVGSKIRSQANELVEALMKCTPHYVRCIKPNETKKPRDWEESRVKHQVEYLGLKENVRVRRAGFAYRRVFQKFLQRYAILSQETWPVFRGSDPRDGIEKIMQASHMEREQYQMGRTKIFIKAPESLFQLEELRERRFDGYARVIQRAFRKYFANRQRQKQREEAAAIVFGKKQRRKYSINRTFIGDYIGLDFRSDLLSLVGRREKVEFCETVTKYDRRFKATKRDLFITNQRVLLIGREKIKQGPKKGLILPVIKRDMPYKDLIKVSLSTRQDDLVILHIRNSYDTIIESVFKTELLTVLDKKHKMVTGQALNLHFSDQLEFAIKKEGWGGGGTRTIKFTPGISPAVLLKASGKVLNVQICDGLPSNTRPGLVSFVKKTNNNTQSYKSVPNSRFIQNNGNANNYTTNNSTSSSNNSSQNSFHFSNGSVSNGRISQQSRPPSIIPPSPTGNGQYRPNLNPPPPPTDPCPANQPTIIPQGGFKLPPLNGQQYQQPRFSVKKKTGAGNSMGKGNANQKLAEILQTPNAGLAGAKRDSLSGKKPVPGAGRPKPKPKPTITYPKCKALYDYEARDIDELKIKQDEIIEILEEHHSGWWRGRLGKLEGLFPANYVEKI